MKILIQPFSKKLINGKRNPKDYPYWKELIELFKDHEIVQVGVEGEEQLVQDFRKNLPLKEIKNLILECDTFISIDSFLQHLAWTLDKRGIVIFGQSDPLIFGHTENMNILKDRKYLRKHQFATWEETEYIEEAFVAPEVIYENIVACS